MPVHRPSVIVLQSPQIRSRGETGIIDILTSSGGTPALFPASMNYLFEYLQLLSPDEIILLGSIDLPGREREVLDHLLSLRSSKNPSREKSIARLGISISHFDKTCSVLLRKIYATIVPEMGTALLYDLNRRVLHTHFLHELRR